NSNGTVAPWANTASLPVARRGHGFVAHDGFLYAIGGSSGSDYTSSIYRSVLDPTTGAAGTWGLITPALPAPRVGAGVAVLNGRLWVAGGSGSIGTYSSVVYHTTFNADGSINTWQTSTSLPSGRYGLTLTAGQGKYLYAIGGTNLASGQTNEVWYAQPAADGSITAWTAATGLPQARYLHAAAAYNGYLHVVGGDTGSGTGQPTVYTAPMNVVGSLGAWTQAMPLPVLLKQHGLVAVNGFLHVIGGYDGLEQVWTAPVLPSSQLGAWTSTAPLFNGVFTPGVAVERGRVYVSGGAKGAATYGSTAMAVLNTPAQVAEYSRLTDFGVVARWKYFYWNGNSNPGGVYLQYRAADDDTVFRPLQVWGDVPKITYVYPDVDGTRYLWTRLLLDGTTTATVLLDVLERDVDYFYLNYTDLCAGKTCPAIDECHTQGVCDPYTGVCSEPHQPDGTGCNDGNACSVTDTCQGGVCTGGNWVICEALGQCYYAGTCNSVTGECSNPFKPASETCDDGRSCTTGDHCNGAGVCIAGVDNCACTSNGDCTPRHACELQGTCNTGTGECTWPSAPGGTACNDGSLCTQVDQCDGAGTCVGGSPVVCTALDQCHNIGTCNPATGVCSNPIKPDGTGCNDGKACSQTDTCQGGTCAGGNWKTCSALDQCHDVGTCQEPSGTCTDPAKPDGTECTDGSLCTQVDRCVAGACVPGTPVVCTAFDQCHRAGTCNPGTGVCDDPTQPNGTGCDDGNACTRTDTCQGGTCTGGNPVTCTALDQCHEVGTCDTGSGQCSNPAKPDGTGCNDNSNCTTGESCQAGVCGSPTSTVTCTALDQCHEIGTCDPATGNCSNPIKPNGTGCDDGKPCTDNDTCQAGACVPAVNNCGCTTNGDCLALDQCHDNGTCGGDFKCTYPVKPNGTTCNDGDACTQTDTCQAGVCTGGNPKTCAAPDQCHEAGVCDPGTGSCTYANKTDGTPCNDGDLCTQSDTCQLGACVGGDPKVCANDECRFGGTCVPSTGQCDGAPKPDGTSCNDGNKCTQNDQCTAGACAGTAITCVTLDTCHTAGTCNPATGLCSNPPKLNGTGCDDANACTSGETCTNGACGTPTSVVGCTPLDQCHAAGTCDPQTGLCSDPIRPNGTPCNDEKACTTGETCQAGTCTPAATDCSCTLTSDCSPPTQCQVAVVCNSAHKCEYVLKTNGTPCDDGDACTTGETCQGGSCGSPTSTVVCAALDQCHAAGRCDPVAGLCTDPIKADGAGCDDGRACTTGDACQAGVCVAAVNNCPCALDSDCPPPSQCYDQGTCNTGTSRCVDAPKADGTPCDDGNACTSGESCQGGVCGSHTSVVSCPALDTCHSAGVCDVATGRCSDPLKADSTVCDDGDDCTAGETCQGGLCTGGTASCLDGGQEDGGQSDGGVDGVVQTDAGVDGPAQTDGAPADAVAQEDAATGDGAVTQEVKSYLACDCTAAGAGAQATSPWWFLVGLAAALLGRRRRR
ncbi:MAG: hypothetical protein HY906_07310, partial [Deltaproteobacteria bacterium]|nr:hypothetical protein [Deltaproteobacteria bacterium]